MPLKLQFKLIISSLVVLLLLPILLYFLADNAVSQFIISFSSYFGVVIALLGIYLLMINYLQHKEMFETEENKRVSRGYFQIEKVNISPEFTHLTENKTSKLMVTDNFKRYEKNEPMNFYQINLITEAKMILNLEVEVEYKDLNFTDRLYVARVEERTELFMPQRLSQTIENTFELIELKTIELKYETLAGERMSVLYEEDYQKMSCFGEDSLGKEVKLYTEYLNGVELRSLR